MTVPQIVQAIRGIYETMGEKLFPGCSEEEIDRLKTVVNEDYGIPLPREYLDMLRLTNGFGYDGYGIYASRPIYYSPGDESPAEDGIIEANKGMKLDGVEIIGGLCFGTGDDYLFGMNLGSGEFYQFDVYRQPIRQFDSFEEMFRFMFEPRLSDV